MTPPKTLYRSLCVGDLLSIPHGGRLLQSVVLRRDGEDIFLSCPHEELDDIHPHTANPVRWDDDRKSLVNCDGKTVFWYSENITLERGAAIKVAEVYARIPRKENVRVRPTDFDRRRLLESDTLQILIGILQNGEAGDLGEQLSLVLDALKIQHDGYQLEGILSAIAVIREEAEMIATSSIIGQMEDKLEEFHAMDECASAGRLN